MKHARYVKDQCILRADIIQQLPEHYIPFDIFSTATNLYGFIKVLVDWCNFYAQQNDREFHTNKQKIRQFLEFNYMMSINNLPTIKSYLECGQFIGNEDIRNVMARSIFEDILQNIHFFNKTKDDKSDKRLQSQIPYQSF